MSPVRVKIAGLHRYYRTSSFSHDATMKIAIPLPVESVTPAKVLRRFRVVFNAIRTHFRQMEKQVGLGGAQVWALSVIKANPGIGMGEVAANMDIHQSTASNLVKALLRKELITLEKAPEDRRNVRLKILPAGSRLLKKVTGPFEGVLPMALSSLSGETLLRLDEDLGQLISLLNADEAAEEMPLANL
jgi:DNA-binding MarR family transcriptional regulator